MVVGLACPQRPTDPLTPLVLIQRRIYKNETTYAEETHAFAEHRCIHNQTPDLGLLTGLTVLPVLAGVELVELVFQLHVSYFLFVAAASQCQLVFCGLLVVETCPARVLLPEQVPEGFQHTPVAVFAVHNNQRLFLGPALHILNDLY